MEVKPITEEEAEYFSDQASTISTESEEIPYIHAKFIELFYEMDCNGTEAYLAAVAPKKIRRNSAATYACQLMKKYNLRSKRKDSRVGIKKKDIQRSPRNAEEMIRYVKKNLVAGIIDEREAWEKMTSLARNSTSEQVQFNASKELYAWIKEAKADITSNSLSEQDIVSLLIDAIGDLPAEKYLGVLRGARKKRHDLIARRAENLDVDAIIAEERRLAAQ